mmetsp:Transcript_14079/g.18363  ORF Transcript_14079/g.18363 Transcript_14079/m.18363 type:complete len:503 (-) Transcript_14079:235-1743(-)
MRKSSSLSIRIMTQESKKINNNINNSSNKNNYCAIRTSVVKSNGNDNNNNVYEEEEEARARAQLFVDGGDVPQGGTATILSEIISISKNLLGAGVLSMSGGIAMYADTPWAVINASLWIVAQAIIFGYFAILIAKVCKLTESRTIRDCWERTMGNRYAAAVVVVIGLNPCQGTLAYSAILSQTLQSLVATAGVGIELTYLQSLLLVTSVALLPLCLMKNIQALAPFSVLGTLSVLLTAVGMIWRCVDGSYRPGGTYYYNNNLEEDSNNHSSISNTNMGRPLFGTRYEPWSFKVLPLACMIFEAYVMHYNSPRFYRELSHKSIGRYTACIGGSFGFSAMIYVAIASAGFLTFGGNADNYILNSYSTRDPVATACRLFIGISILTIYPIAFIGFRDALLDVMRVPIEQQTARYLNILTVVMLSLITLTAAFVTDLGVINAVGGGTVAVAMVAVFPFLMFQKAIQDLGHTAVRGQLLEVKIAMLLMVFVVVIGVGGVATELVMGV